MGEHISTVAIGVRQDLAKANASASAGVACAILHGDAFDLLDSLKPSSIDLLITSPPYWGHRDYGLYHNWELFNDIPTVREIGPKSPGYNWYRQRGGLLGLEPYPEWFVQHLTEIIGKARASLRATGSMWINVGDTFFARWASIREQGRQGLGTDKRHRRKTPLGGIRQEKNLLLIPARFAIAMQDEGWILRNDLIWSKPNAVPRPEGDRLRCTHEHFFHFVKKPSAGRPAYYYDSDQAEARAADVVTVNVAPGEGGHSATFPYELIAPRILTSCPPGGTVLDPFAGTGRALEVALESGRNAIGFDAQKAFVDLATEKINGNQQPWQQFRQ
jgi:DNA modification methylase